MLNFKFEKIKIKYLEGVDVGWRRARILALLGFRRNFPAGVKHRKVCMDESTCYGCD